MLPHEPAGCLNADLNLVQECELRIEVRPEHVVAIMVRCPPCCVTACHVISVTPSSVTKASCSTELVAINRVLQLVSGEAEVFGTSLLPGQPVALRAQKVAVGLAMRRSSSESAASMALVVMGLTGNLSCRCSPGQGAQSMCLQRSTPLQQLQTSCEQQDAVHQICKAPWHEHWQTMLTSHNSLGAEHFC